MSEKTNSFRDFEHAGWQKAAVQYGPGFGAVTIQAIGPLLEALSAGPGIRLLDVACGPGFVAASAQLRRCSVVGIDFSSAMIAEARKNYPALEFHEGDAESLNFSADAFDAVAMNFGMLHLSDPDKAIAEAFRVLRPGGHYAFTVWDTPPHTAGFEIVLDSVRRYGNMDVPLPEGPPFFRFSDSFESARALNAAGFIEVQSTVVPQVWRMESGEVLFATMRRAAVRTAALLNMQNSDELEKIEKEISTRAEAFRKNGEIELPMPAILTFATKPDLAEY